MLWVPPPPSLCSVKQWYFILNVKIVPLRWWSFSVFLVCLFQSCSANYFQLLFTQLITSCFLFYQMARRTAPSQTGTCQWARFPCRGPNPSAALRSFQGNLPPDKPYYPGQLSAKTDPQTWRTPTKGQILLLQLTGTRRSTWAVCLLSRAKEHWWKAEKVQAPSFLR